MTDKEIIKEQANIDISNLCMAQEQGIITEFGKGKLEALEGIVDFIDSLQEGPVIKGLEEAADEYAPDFSNSIASKAAVDAIRDAFKAGAKWQKEQIIKDAVDAVVSQVPCSNEIILYNPSSVDKYYLPQEMNKLGLNKGDKVKVIIIKSE